MEDSPPRPYCLCGVISNYYLSIRILSVSIIRIEHFPPISFSCTPPFFYCFRDDDGARSGGLSFNIVSSCNGASLSMSWKQFFYLGNEHDVGLPCRCPTHSHVY